MSFAFLVQQATCKLPEELAPKVRPELAGLKAGAATLKARALDLEDSLFYAVCEGHGTTKQLDTFCPSSRPTMNRHLRSLIKQGLLKREKDPTKSRGYLYTPTDKGRTKYDEIKK